jgi:hypothetical protein
MGPGLELENVVGEGWRGEGVAVTPGFEAPVGDLTPGRVVRRLSVGDVEGVRVGVQLVEQESMGVVSTAVDVETQATRLLSERCSRVGADPFEELLEQKRPDGQVDEHDEHA